MEVADIMTTSLITIGPQTTWSRIAEIILNTDVSGLPVIDASDNLVGMVTEADLMRRPALGVNRPGSPPPDGPVEWDEASRVTAADIMTPDLFCTTPHEDVRVAAARMLHANVKRLPVVEGRRLVGIVSRRELVGAFYRDDDDIADELERRLAEAGAPEVKVHEGVVTLSGRVPTKQDRSAAEVLCWQSLGVAGVIDLLATDEDG